MAAELGCCKGTYFMLLEQGHVPKNEVSQLVEFVIWYNSLPATCQVAACYVVHCSHVAQGAKKQQPKKSCCFSGSTWQPCVWRRLTWSRVAAAKTPKKELRHPVRRASHTTHPSQYPCQKTSQGLIEASYRGTQERGVA